MDAAPQPFSDSDITSTSYYSTGVGAAPVEPFLAADLEALRRLSEQLGSLLRSPSLHFSSDAHITVRSDCATDPQLKVPVHRCILSARSPFFRERFANGEMELDLGQLAVGFEVGYDALRAVLEYVYTGRVEQLPSGVAECADEDCRHEACWPAVNFMLQVLFAAATFEIYELVNLFQRRLVDILQKVAIDDMLVVVHVANLCKKACQRLLYGCIEIVGKSDIDYMTLDKKLPHDVVKQIIELCSNLNLGGLASLTFPDRNAKSIYKALDSDDVQLVEWLLQEGGTTLDNANALHYAVAHCNSRVTKKLLDLELADVNRINHRGYTVLHIAAMRKDPEIIMALLKMGAEPSSLTPDRRKAVQISKRLTRSIDYYKPTERGKASPKEKLCIEMLEQAEIKDSLTEATSVPPVMASDDHERLLYLESRVWLAQLLFPMEAKVAMNNAQVEGTLKFSSSSISKVSAGSKRPAVDETNSTFQMKEEFLSRMKALSKTVELGMRYFPRCSRIIERFLGDDLSELSILEHINSEERKKRYNEIQDEIKKAYSQDKETFNGGRAAPSSSSSKSARAVKTKLSKK